MVRRVVSSGPDVSVVLVMRNSAATLSACLDSLRDQTLEDYEVIIVDDGSNDASVDLARRAARRDSRLRLVSLPRVGLVEGLNLGQRLARGRFVARMDADDCMHIERLRLQRQFLLGRGDISLVASRVHTFPAANVGAGMAHYLRWQNTCLSPDDIAADIFVESPFTHASVMFRRDDVLRLGGYRDGPYPEDYELWLRMHAAGRRFAKLGQTLHRWRQSPGSLSKTDPRYARSAFDKLRAHYLARDQRLAGSRPIAYWGAGRRTRKRSNLLIAKGHPPSIWIDIDPRKVGRTLGGVMVVKPDWIDLPATRAMAPFVLSYVTNHGARALIDAQLREYGYRRGTDYCMVG